MDEKMTFSMIKTIIMKQNEAFIRDLAKKFNKDPEDMVKKYLHPSYYLPILERTKK